MDENIPSTVGQTKAPKANNRFKAIKDIENYVSDWHGKYESFFQNHKWLKLFGDPLSNIFTAVALPGFGAFCKTSSVLLQKESFIKTLWWVALAIFLWRAFTSFLRLKKQFPLGLHFIILVFALIAYFLYIPSTPVPFRHNENPDTLSAFITENRNDPMSLLNKGVNLYRRGEHAWSYLCIESAVNPL